MANISPIMTIMQRAAEKAARSLNRDFGEVENLQVSRKGPADFVTAADKRSEEIIFEELKYARSDYSFMMEESGEIKGENTDHVWIVDPLDGTMNFMHGLPHWAISIALEVKGRVEAGLVYDPIKDEMFHAERSAGAFVRRQRLRVSNRNQMESAIIISGYPGYQDKGRQDQFKEEYSKVISLSPSVRRLGAAALDLSYIAAGRADGYWERGLKPWDCAAGALIVKEAGGFISSIDNRDNPIYSKNLVSGNGTIYNDLKKLLKS